jgi:hypothetical protein
LKVVDSDRLTLEQLIKLRKSERKTSGHALRDLRHRFSERIALQGKALCGARSKGDLNELGRQFQEEMHDDYEALKDSLKLEAKQVLGTKEIVAAVLAIADVAAAFHLHDISTGVAALAAAGSAIAVGGLYSTKAKFAATRRKTLKEHPTAYLYEAQGGLRI